MKVLILCNYVTGDEIIVATTDFSPKHTEVMVIREIVSARMVRLQGKENVPFKFSLILRNRSLGFPTRSDTNQAVQPQKMARSFKFRI